MHQLIAAFLLDRRAAGCTEKTLAWHEASLSLFTRWIEQQGHAADSAAWTPHVLRSFIVDLQARPSRNGRPLSGASVNSYVGSLLAFVRWLHEEEYTATNIGERIKKPRRPQIVKEPFTDAELHAMLTTARNSNHGFRDYAFIASCSTAGSGHRSSPTSRLPT